MPLTNNYKSLCESRPARLIAEVELQGGLGGDNNPPFDDPELPEHLRPKKPRKAKVNQHYVDLLEAKVEEIKNDIEDPSVSAASIANELIVMIRENTNWKNSKEKTKGKTALVQILGNLGLSHMTASPDMQIPEQEDWDGYDQWNLRVKRSLHSFAYNQYLVANGLATIKLQHRSQHTTPYRDDINRNNIPLTESFDAVESFLKKAMKLYFLPMTFPIELIVKAVRGEADGREQAAAINAIDQASSENPELEKVDLWKEIGDHVENGDQGEPDPWPDGEYDSPEPEQEEYDSPEPEQDPLQPHVTYAGANMESVVPSLAALEVLAKCDTSTFCNILESIGLRILGTHKFDPLDIRVRKQAIASLASNMTEAIDDDIDLAPELAAIKNLAESFGYIVETQEQPDMKDALAAFDAHELRHTNPRAALIEVAKHFGIPPRELRDVILRSPKHSSQIVGVGQQGVKDNDDFSY